MINLNNSIEYANMIILMRYECLCGCSNHALTSCFISRPTYHTIYYFENIGKIKNKIYSLN